MLKIAKKLFITYLLFSTCLIGLEATAQSDSFGVQYPSLNSMTFLDIEYLPGEYLIGLTGDFLTYNLMLIDADNYLVLDSLPLDNFNFELVDLYQAQDGFKLTGVNILDSTLHSLEIEIDNNILSVIPLLHEKLPSYYLQGTRPGFGTFILETISYSGEDFGCISSGLGASAIFKITEDSITFEIPSPTLAFAREVKVIDSLLVIPSLNRISFVQLKNLKPVTSIFDIEVFKNAGWIYKWDSMFVFTDQLNSTSILASQVMVKFLSEDFSIIKTDTIGHHDSLNNNANNNPVSFYSDSNNIYVGGSLGGLFGAENLRKFTNSFYLASYNRTLEQDWFLELSNDANYAMSGVLTLENDNALIYGYEGREERNWKAYPFLIEIDKEGYVVSSTRPMEHRTNEILLYPNPASDNLYVKLEDIHHGAFDISIFDQSGKLVMIKRGISDQENINISTLPKGMYYLSLTRKGKRWASRKFVKVN